MDYPKLANCSFRDIEHACNKLGKCTVSTASKHVIKITNARNEAFVIPSAKPLKRGLVWDFVRSFLIGKCGFTEQQIFAVLWC